jgi:hypothetical protein
MHARPPLSIVTALLCALATLAGPAAHAHAQAIVPDERGVLADAWVEHLREQEDDSDTFLRYFAAPAAVFLGGFTLAEPAWGELTPGADLAFVVGGAAFLSAAVGAWATPDPYDAQRWYGSTASLGFAGVGVGLLAFCVDEDSTCNAKPFPRHMGAAIGIVNAGVFLTTFFLWTFAPPPSPGALQLSLRGLPPEQRHARVLTFLERRERSRRLATYLTVPWGIALGASFLGFAHDAGSSDGRALVYGCGGVMLGVVAATTLYELLRTPDTERFLAGERPDE